VTKKHTDAQTWHRQGKRSLRPRSALRVTVARRPIYTIDVDQVEMVNLADGIVLESVARRAHACLGWQRTALREAARVKLIARKARRTTTK
jgi:hypothetical protein